MSSHWGKKYLRGTAYERQDGKCMWCGEVVAEEEATAEHIVRRFEGGKTIDRNIGMSCGPCNWGRHRQRKQEDAHVRAWRHFLSRTLSQSDAHVRRWRRVLIKEMRKVESEK